MPLDPSKLARALIQIDAASPKDSVTAASLWTDAIVDFTSDLTQLLVPESAKVGQPALFAAMITAFPPVGTWPTFCAAFEAALRVYLPLITLPALINIPGGVYVPSPLPLTPLILPTFVLGLASPTSGPPRTFMASTVYGWYLTNTILPVSGPPIPFV